MQKLYYILFIGFFSLTACNNEITQQLEPKGSALGKMNEIVVITDKNMWEGAVGDTFRYYFQSAYPILPLPEPLFDLRQFTVEDLQVQPLRKELRTYVVLANLADELSSTTQMVMKDLGDERYYNARTKGEIKSSVGKDKWARGQILFYLFGNTHDDIAESIKTHFPAIARRVNEHDEKQLKSSIYIDRVHRGLSRQVTEDFGLSIEVPGDYQVAKEDRDNQVLWLRKDTKDAILNMVFRKLPYNNEAQLTQKNVIELRNEFGANYITSDIDNNVMQVNDKDLPVYEYTLELDGRYTKEFRGVWEMTKSYAGGPFSTYVIVDEANRSLIYADVFVMAPGANKRNYMMQLDHIIKSGKILNSSVVQ